MSALLCLWRKHYQSNVLGGMRGYAPRNQNPCFLILDQPKTAALLAIIDTADAVLPLIVTYRRGLHLA